MVRDKLEVFLTVQLVLTKPRSLCAQDIGSIPPVAAKEMVADTNQQGVSAKSAYL